MPRSTLAMVMPRSTARRSERGRVGASAMLSFALLLVSAHHDGVVGAALGSDEARVEKSGVPRGDDGTRSRGADAMMQRLQREAKRDERGADREAAKAQKLEKEVGEPGMASQFKKLEQEIDADPTPKAAADVLRAVLDAGGKKTTGEGDGRSKQADGEEEKDDETEQTQDAVPGETGIESMVQEGREVMNMMDGSVEDAGRGKDKLAGEGNKDTAGQNVRDSIAEAEMEGGCLGDCQGQCTSACHSSITFRSKENLSQCGNACEQKCVKKCQDVVGKALPAQDLRAARLSARREAKEASMSTAERQPAQKWGWAQKMEADEAVGKQTGSLPIMGKPMDDVCKKECMGKCQRRCGKKSKTPEKCPKQCTEQCEDDCYIVGDGGPPDADVFAPGTGEEGLDDEPNKLMTRCMGECHEQCLPPCAAKGGGTNGKNRRQREITIHLNCSQTCRGTCLHDCEPMVEKRVQVRVTAGRRVWGAET